MCLLVCELAVFCLCAAACCLDLQRGVEVRSKSLQHLPYLNYYVSLSSAFQGVEIQLFEGNVVIFTDSFDFPNEGLLNLLKLLDVSFIDW